MADLLEDLAPLFFVLLLNLAGLIGDRFIRRSAQRTAAAAEKLGGDYLVVRDAAGYLAEGVLAVTSFLGTWFALALAWGFAFHSVTTGLWHWSLVVVAITAVIELVIFISITLNHDTHELSNSRVVLVFFGRPHPWKRTWSQLINVGTMLLIILTIVVTLAKNQGEKPDPECPAACSQRQAG